jgi:hypothetical protein
VRAVNSGRKRVQDGVLNGLAPRERRVAIGKSGKRVQDDARGGVVLQTDEGAQRLGEERGLGRATEG